jgi:cysteine desulfurase
VETRTHYLDNNATTRVDPAVLEAMLPWLGDECGNPSSAYGLGRRAAAAIAGAREAVAALVGRLPEEILFTSCGTEAITTAILACAARDPDRRHIVTTRTEHSATLKLCDHLARRGYEITRLPVDSSGLLDPRLVLEAIRDDTALVSILLANNETGVLFPAAEIAALAAEKNVPVHVDAVQAAGKIPVDLPEARFVSLSGHKLYCPKGVGALVVDRRMRFEPLLRGSQESGRRGGTENVASIVAFGKAAELALKALESEPARIRALRDRFETSLLAGVPGCSLNGNPKTRLPNTSNLAFEGIESEAALILLDQEGICCSAGSACTSGSVHPSHVLLAMGCPKERATASLRFSFGRFNTDADVDSACRVTLRAIEKLRGLRAAGPVAFAAASG